MYIKYFNMVGTNPDCHPSTGTGMDPQCCTNGYNKGVFCSEGQGDCDYDKECFGDLKCGINNCGTSFRAGYDCCYDPKKRMSLKLLHCGNIFYWLYM